MLFLLKEEVEALRKQTKVLCETAALPQPTIWIHAMIVPIYISQKNSNEFAK